MTETRTETEWTPHGEVEYEVVTCASCKLDVKKGDTRRAYIGGVVSVEKDYATSTLIKFDSTSTLKARICEDCVDKSYLEPPIQQKAAAKGLSFLLGVLLTWGVVAIL